MGMTYCTSRVRFCVYAYINETDLAKLLTTPFQL